MTKIWTHFSPTSQRKLHILTLLRTNPGLDAQDVWFVLAIPFIVGLIPPLTPSL